MASLPDQADMAGDRLTHPGRVYPVLNGVLRRVTPFVFIAAQLALVLYALKLFRVGEAFGLTRLLPLLFAGFVVHAIAPRPVRPVLFLGLSFAAVGQLFGLRAGAALVATGLVLVGVCHLPVRVRYRVAILLFLTMGLALVRVDRIDVGIPSLVLPVLGSMFMFRLILYLYHVAHNSEAAGVAQRLGYFFMLPNVCMPLFPIVDYDTYLRRYYDTEAHRIYQKGVHWMARGLLHILLYRAIYHYLWIEPSQVTTLGTLVYFMVTSYALYLRVSGQLHLAVGMLCLFGFNLPKTHYLYFMATGFNDLWRRMNIYWKDFMMKCFYYPLYFRLRRSGSTRAMVLGVLFVFLGTWFLHSYQWFWLRGSFPVTPVDAVFWSVFALLMVANSLIEMRRRRPTRLARDSLSNSDIMVTSLKGVAMFSTMCVLWSFISSSTVREWIGLMGAARTVQPGDLRGIGLFLLALFVLFACIHRIIGVYRDRPETFTRSAMASVPMIAAFLVLGSPVIQPWLGESWEAFAETLQSDRLNQRDQDLMDRGYYERVMTLDRYTAQLWDVQLQAPPGWNDPSPIINRDWSRPFSWELYPLLDTTFKRGRLTTNRWGMRDKDCEKEKPAGTYRIAVLGGSATFGSGVDDGINFESQLEERINRENRGSVYERYEFLNFSVPGHDLLRRVLTLDEKALAFDPDMVWHVSIGPEEPRGVVNRLIAAVQRGATWPYEDLEKMRIETGVTPEMTEAEIRRRLEPCGPALVEWGYRRMVDTCRARGIVPVWVFMANPRRKVDGAELAAIEGVARDAGFEILSTYGAFDGLRLEGLRITPWDAHPNAKAHRLLADKLHEQLLTGEDKWNLGLQPRGPTGVAAPR